MRYLDGKQWVKIWKRAGEELARIKEQELQELTDADVAFAMEALSDACESALRLPPPRMTSGLLEQQGLFMKAHGEGRGRWFQKS